MNKIFIFIVGGCGGSFIIGHIIAHKIWGQTKRKRSEPKWVHGSLKLFLNLCIFIWGGFIFILLVSAIECENCDKGFIGAFQSDGALQSDIKSNYPKESSQTDNKNLKILHPYFFGSGSKQLSTEQKLQQTLEQMDKKLKRIEDCVLLELLCF